MFCMEGEVIGGDSPVLDCERARVGEGFGECKGCLTSFSRGEKWLSRGEGCKRSKELLSEGERGGVVCFSRGDSVFRGEGVQGIVIFSFSCLFLGEGEMISWFLGDIIFGGEGGAK